MSAALALPRAVLDSNVIYSRVLHELMGRVALEGRFVDLIWSAALLEEAERVLIDGKGLAPHVAKRWIDHLPSSFPEGEVKDLEVPSDVDLASMRPWLPSFGSRRAWRPSGRTRPVAVCRDRG